MTAAELDAITVLHAVDGRPINKAATIGADGAVDAA